MDRLDVDALDEVWPFEVGSQAAHLFKHPGLVLDDVSEVWTGEHRRRPPRPPLPGGPMTDVTPGQENAFYADPDNQEPQGSLVRRKA